MPLPQKKLIPGILFALMLAAFAAPPLWWSTGNSPVIDPAAAVNNKGPANIGQAKHMAKSALDALRPILPNVADQIEADLVGIGKPIPSWVAPANQAEKDKNHAPLLIGQLKAIADPFYTRLHAAAPTWLEAERIANGTQHPGSIFPWTAATTDDANKAIANIGQLKAVFSLRFENLQVSLTDTDGDGMPDAWEIAHGLDPNDASDAILDSDGDGLTNHAELTAGTDPRNQDADGDGIPDPIDAQPLVSAFIFPDADGDGIADGNDAQPASPRGPPPSVSSETASGNPVCDLIKNETVRFILAVSNPAGPAPSASDLAFFINGTEEPATITAIGSPAASTQRFLFTWNAKTTAGYPARTLQNLTLRFRDSQQATSWFKLARIDVAEWQGMIAGSMAGQPSDDYWEARIRLHTQGVYQTPTDLAYDNEGIATWYRGPKVVPIYRYGVSTADTSFEISSGMRYPLVFISRAGSGPLSIHSVTDIADPVTYPHEGFWYHNTYTRDIKVSRPPSDMVIPVGTSKHHPMPERTETSSVINVWIYYRDGAKAWKGYYNTNWSTHTAEGRRLMHSMNFVGTKGVTSPDFIVATTYMRTEASIVPHATGSLEVPGLPLPDAYHTRSGTKPPVLLPLSQDSWHKTLLRVGPDAAAISNGIDLRLRKGQAGDADPQTGFTILVGNPDGTQTNLAVPIDGKITLAAGSPNWQRLTSPEGLTLFIKRNGSVTDVHDLSLHLLKKRVWYAAESVQIASIDLLPVEVVEVSPKMKDEDGNEIAGSEKPNIGKPLTPFVEVDPNANKIAHREIKVKIGDALKDKKVTWTIEALPGATPATIRGEWDDSPTHKDRFEASATYGANAFRKVSQSSGETTVGADGHTAIRVNVPPIGFNQVRIKIQIEGMSTPMDLIDMEVPGVVVIDPGHGGQDSGAVGRTDTSILEKDLALEYSLSLRQKVIDKFAAERHGLRMVMTRKTTGEYMQNSVRANLAGDKGADVFISVHFNSGASSARGTETLVRGNSNVNEPEDTALANLFLASTLAAVQSQDAATISRGVKNYAWSQSQQQNVPSQWAVLSDSGYGNTNDFHPIRGSIVEVEFLSHETALESVKLSNAKGTAIKTKFAADVSTDIYNNILNQP